MLKIQKLKRPTKKSGWHLPQGESTDVRGLQVINISGGPNVYVDKWTRKVSKKKKR